MKPFIPLSFLVKDPLKNSKEIFEETAGSIISSIGTEKIKDEVLDFLDNNNLPISQIIVWNWKLLDAQIKRPHTDGNYFKEGSKRLNGINWVLNEDSVLDFWDVERTDSQANMESTGITRYTFWDIEGLPSDTWNSEYPALVNPQIPHRVRSLNGQNLRQSVIIALDNNLSFSDIAKILETNGHIKI